MNGDLEFITLAESFRVYLDARFPQERGLADEILKIGYHWFWPSVRPHRARDRDAVAVAAAKAACEALRTAIQSGAVRVGCPRAPIDPEELIHAEPDFLDGTGRIDITLLRTLDDGTTGGTTVDSHEPATVARADIEKLAGIAPKVKNKPGRKFKHDWDAARLKAGQLWKERGDPLVQRNHNPGWYCDDDLFKAVAGEMAIGPNLKGPDYKQVGRQLRELVKELRART